MSGLRLHVQCPVVMAALSKLQPVFRIQPQGPWLLEQHRFTGGTGQLGFERIRGDPRDTAVDLHGQQSRVL